MKTKYESRIIAHRVLDDSGEGRRKFEKEVSEAFDTVKRQVELQKIPGMIPVLDRFYSVHYDQETGTLIALMTWAVDVQPAPSGMGYQGPVSQ